MIESVPLDMVQTNNLLAKRHRLCHSATTHSQRSWMKNIICLTFEYYNSFYAVSEILSLQNKSSMTNSYFLFDG